MYRTDKTLKNCHFDFSFQLLNVPGSIKDTACVISKLLKVITKKNNHNLMKDFRIMS